MKYIIQGIENACKRKREVKGIMEHKKDGVLKTIFKSKEVSIFLICVLLSILIEIKNPIFLTYNNIMDVLRNTSYTLIIAVGMTFVLIARGLDLSVGSMFAFGGLLAATMMTNGVPIILSVLIALVVCTLLGAVNAFCIVKLKVPPMIATLGSMYMVRGLVLVLTKGQPVYPLPDAFAGFGKLKLVGIPCIIIIAAIISIIAHWVLNRTTYGRSVYAVGGNPETAKYAGINVKWITATCYMISGALAAMAGILNAARMGSGQPTVGDGTEMTVITAVIIGGVSLNGGAGSVLGTVLGTLLMNILSTGMNLVGVSAYWQKFVMGLIIVIAVAFDQYQRSKKKE